MATTVSAPAEVAIPTKKAQVKETRVKLQHLRITLTSRNVPSLQKVCEDIVREAKTNNLKVRGPVPMPTKVLRITSRKTPCGEGTNSWHRWEMRIHKRVIDLHARSDVVRKIVGIDISSDVNVEVTVAN
eukprot:TRINITY_DN314_c0_g1_i1.p1 TRINITY_DN314_c0_g1~~TRINITY_DN314_c0_g1_i1.p1  ORF type:complete len:129 (-),score=64.21 TRINITY_DN314_c0_g1_i1:201-587(-)